MGFRDPIRVGDSGKLRVQFLDSNEQPIQATSVTVDLFAPGLDPTVDTPTITGLVPTFLGDGVFEIVFTADAPGGGWQDRWTGTILGTVTTSVLAFTVINEGVIGTYPISGLQDDTFVEVTVTKDVKSITGQSLPDETSISFTTTLIPFYSSVRKVRLDAGGVLSKVPDNVIDLAILEASIEADVMHFRKEIINNNVFQHARREYTTATAAQVLANNILASKGLLRSKSLADFKVEYDPAVIANLLQALDKQASKWLEQVQSGGGTRVLRNARMVIKGELDPDRPNIGRGWYGVSPVEQPIGNFKYKVHGSRRFRTGWFWNRGTTGGGNPW